MKKIYGNMATIKIEQGSSISSDTFAANNMYIIEYNFDLNNNIIVLPENVVLKFLVGGKFSTGTLIGKETKIYCEDACFDNDIQFEGTFIPLNMPTIGLSRDIQSLNFPIGFRVKTFGFYSMGDKGEGEFFVLDRKLYSFYKHLNLIDIDDNDTKLWILECANEILVEKAGVIPEDETKNDFNARIIERLNAHFIWAVFRQKTTYYISNICVNNISKIKGAIANQSIHIFLKGEIGTTDSSSKAIIITKETNLSYCKGSLGMTRVNIKHLLIQTTNESYFVGNEDSETGPYRKRKGFGYTCFPASTPDEVIIEGITLPDLFSCDHSLVSDDVIFMGFLAGFYSPNFSTICDVRNTSFSVCYYGFVSRGASNISTFYRITINQCVVGIIVGGVNCTINFIDITPACKYIKHKDDWDENTKVIGYESPGSNYSITINDVYLEDYSGDAESQSRFIQFYLHTSFRFTLNRCAFISKKTGTNNYAHIFLAKGAVPSQRERQIIIRDSDYPYIVKSDGIPASGIVFDGYEFKSDYLTHDISGKFGSMLFNEIPYRLSGKPMFTMSYGNRNIPNGVFLSIDKFHQRNIDLYLPNPDNFSSRYLPDFFSGCPSIILKENKNYNICFTLHKKVTSIGVYKLIFSIKNIILCVKDFNSYRKGDNYYLDIEMNINTGYLSTGGVLGIGFVIGRYGLMIPTEEANTEDHYTLNVINGPC